MSKLEEIINTQLDAAHARGILDERSGATNKKPMIHDIKFNARQQIKDLMLEVYNKAIKAHFVDRTAASLDEAFYKAVTEL